MSTAMRLGTLAWPTIVTPCFTTTLPNSGNGTIAALLDRQIDDHQPGFIDCTISSVTSTGALRPGMRAVVMTTSCFF